MDKNTPKIVVVGQHANSSGLQSGGWTIDWQGNSDNYTGATTILEGIEEMADGKVVYDPDGSQVHEDADIAIICIGESPYAEFYGDVGHDTG